MATDDAIRAVKIIETEFGEKVALESPFEAKEFISALPWQSLEDEIAQHGSLRDKLEERDVDPIAIDAAEQFSFSNDFAAHATWSPNALGHGDGAWLVDVDSFNESAEFFEFCGYRVEIENDLEL